MTHEPENSNVENAEIEENSLLPLVLAMVVLLLGLYGGYTWWRVEQAHAEKSSAMSGMSVGPPLKVFELTERSGKPFRSEAMLGKVWVTTYFFTTCPGSCLRLNQSIRYLHNLEELQDVTWVSITCDPDTDTIEALTEYANRFEADPERWLFCRSDMNTIQRIGLGMNLDVYRKGHKDYAVVIDRKGEIRGMFDATSVSHSRRLKKLLLECLAEEAPVDGEMVSENGPIT